MLFLLNYFQRPIHIFGSTGLLMTGAGILTGIYLTLVKFVGGQNIGDRPLLIMPALLIIVGIQMLSIGLVAEMLMRTYYESQDASAYFVRKELAAEAIAPRELEPEAEVA